MPAFYGGVLWAQRVPRNVKFSFGVRADKILSDRPEFEEVRQAFMENLRPRGELGAAVSVSIDSEIVVDLWGGIRDEETGAPWEEDTMVLVIPNNKGRFRSGHGRGPFARLDRLRVAVH
ncbi:serine hydrolase [Symmachiella dynata]|uniref:serine hydrolase n=1 Tax=Symmachiella dynata TaxID=2527995 RepID=UPI0018D2F765|nr:serine hydrolase [Symmachiella dynata]